MKFKYIFALFLCILLCGCAYANDNNVTLDENTISSPEDVLCDAGDLVIPDVVYDWNTSGSVDVECDAEGILLNDSAYEDFVSIKDKTITFSGLPVGKYNISFITSDPILDNVYFDAHVSVNAVESVLKPIDEFDFDWGTGSIGVDYDGALNVTCEVINHTEAVINISNKVISISNLSVGEYVLNVSTVPDRNHSSVSRLVNFKINRIHCNVRYIVDCVKYNQKPVVYVDLPDTATGVFNVVFNNTFYIINLSDGERSVELPLLDVGSYNLFGFYEGDVNYYPVYLPSQFFNVSYYTSDDLQDKIDDAGDILDIDENYMFKEDDKGVNINKSIKINFHGNVVDANLTDHVFNITSNNVILSNLILINCKGTVLNSYANNIGLYNLSFVNSSSCIDIKGNSSVLKNILINNTSRKAIDINADGCLLKNITIFNFIGDAVGVNGQNNELYNIILDGNSGNGIILDGDINYLENIGVFNHKGIPLVINSNNTRLVDSIFVNNADVDVCAVVVNGNNVSIINTVFKNNAVVNGSVIVVRGDNASFLTSSFENNTCFNVICAVNASNIVVDDYTQNHNGIVSEITKINVSDVVVRGFDVLIYLNLTADNGIVYAVIDNQTYCSDVLNGSCILTLDYLPVGEYNIDVYYNGTQYYSKTSLPVNFSVDKQIITFLVDKAVFCVNYDRTFKVNLSPKLTGKTISFTFNGKKYSGLTNDDGVAVFDLEKAVANENIVVNFDGDDRYESASVKLSITISKEKSVIKVSAKKSYRFKGVKKIKVTLMNSKKGALKKKWVYLKVNVKKNNVIKVKTNSKGVAVFKLNMKFKSKKYSYKITYNGDRYFKEVVKTGTFKVR